MTSDTSVSVGRIPFEAMPYVKGTHNQASVREMSERAKTQHLGGAMEAWGTGQVFPLGRRDVEQGPLSAAFDIPASVQGNR